MKRPAKSHFQLSLILELVFFLFCKATRTDAKKKEENNTAMHCYSRTRARKSCEDTSMYNTTFIITIIRPKENKTYTNYVQHNTSNCINPKKHNTFTNMQHKRQH